MDTLPLTPRPDLEQYRKRAKELVKAVRSSDSSAVRVWATGWLDAISGLSGVAVTPFVRSSFDRAIETIEERVREKTGAAGVSAFTLADAQFLIASAHGFENWPALASHLQPQSRKSVESHEHDAAADAVVHGELATLRSLVERHPELIRVRSTRVHRATLLHYVAANGVEDYRQKTPPNAVAVARFLLEQGAEVDALANTYGGGSQATTMNLLVSSVHPAAAGLQSRLVELLLDFGAAIDGLEDDESPLMTALAFGYPDAAETLAHRGARVDNVITAAALGRADLVRTFVIDGATLRHDVPLVAPSSLRLSHDAKAHIELALVWACKFLRIAVAELLLDQGVDPAAKDSQQMTALHHAAANGSLDLVKRLLERGAPLEAKNLWGGTVLSSTLYYARHDPAGGANYPAVIDALILAGAVRSDR